MSTLDPQFQPSQTSAFPPSELIGLLYEAAAEPSRWPFWFDALAASVGHRASNLVIHGFGPTRYVCLDAPGSRFDTINPSRVFENKALSKCSFAIAYVSGEIVEDWSQLQPYGAAPTGVQVFADETRSLDADDRALLRAVLPHLHRALVLHFQLEAFQREHDNLTTCLDELSTGMVLLDTNATVLYANQAALDYLAGQCGLVYENGKLCAPNCNVNQTFQQNLKSATSGQKRSLCGQPLASGATLWLRGLGRDRAVAYIARERQERSLAPELLIDAFDLTPAEARVGSLFAFGHKVDVIAAHLDISVHTVRLHLKKIQGKTGTHRQATLVRRMLEAIPQVNP